MTQLPLACIAAGLLALGATTSVAAAAPAGYEIVTAETAVDTFPEKQVSATCPAGKVVLGAAWADLDSTSAIMDGVATYFLPSWDGSGWMVNVRHESGYEPSWKLRLRLVCALRPSGYQLVTNDSAVNDDSTKQAHPACPAGKLALSAGFGVLDSTSAILDGQATYFLADYNGAGWLMNARNDSAFSPTWKLRSTVICAKWRALPGYQVVTQESALDTVSSKFVELTCPTNKVALGAGWGVVKAGYEILDGVATHFDSYWDGSGWYVFGAAPSWPSDWRLQARALCVN